MSSQGCYVDISKICFLLVVTIQILNAVNISFVAFFGAFSYDKCKYLTFLTVSVCNMTLRNATHIQYGLVLQIVLQIFMKTSCLYCCNTC